MENSPYTYSESLAWLREEFVEWSVDGMGVQAARLRFLLACVALNVPEDRIRDALPGFKNFSHPRRRLAYFPDHDAMPEIDSYYFHDPERWIRAQMVRYKAYLEGELKKAERFRDDRVKRGKVVAKREYTARFRATELDLAERYFVTVRHKILHHPYKDILIDTRLQSETNKQVALALGRLRVAVHTVCEEVHLAKKLKPPVS